MHVLRSVLISVLLGSATIVLAQSEQSSVTPVVVSGEIPIYPPGALKARLQGTIRMEVWTNGTGVRAVQAEKTDAHKALLFAAERNLMTWRFAPHTPTSFHVVFSYRLVEGSTGPENSMVEMKLPYRVDVTAKAQETLDPARQ